MRLVTLILQYQTKLLMMTYITAFKLDQVTYRYRLEFANTSAIKIGVLAIGLRTEFELGFYRDIQPPHLNEDVVVTNKKSESGVFWSPISPYRYCTKHTR